MTAGKFPNGLGEAMERAEIGPTELGRVVGTSKQNIERWQKGSRQLKPLWAEKLAPHVRSTPEALLLLNVEGFNGLREKLSALPKEKMQFALHLVDALPSLTERDLGTLESVLEQALLFNAGGSG